MQRQRAVEEGGDISTRHRVPKELLCTAGEFVVRVTGYRQLEFVVLR